MAEDYMTVREFAGKIDWEGGVLDTIDYGLSEERLDPNDPEAAELRAVWAKARNIYKEQLDPLLVEIGEILDGLGDEGDDEDD